MTNAKTTHLQNIGAHPALPTEELRVGDIMVWNWGYTSEVISIKQVSKCFFEIEEKATDGKVYTRRAKVGRLIACKRAAEK